MTAELIGTFLHTIRKKVRDSSRSHWRAVGEPQKARHSTGKYISLQRVGGLNIAWIRYPTSHQQDIESNHQV